MHDNSIAEYLGAHVAMQDPSTALWLRVTRGELSADEAAARHIELLGSEQAEDPTAVEQAKLVFSPPSRQRRTAVLEALEAQRQQQRRVEGATVVPIAKARWKIVAFTAAAAAVLLLALPVLRPSQEPFSGAYIVELEKAAVSVRGAPTHDEIPRYLPSSPILIRLVPEQKVSGELEVVVFAATESGEAHRLQVAPRVLEFGLVEIDSTVAELGLGPGAWELVIAIGRPGTLPSSWQQAVGMDEQDNGPQLIRQRLDVVTHL